MKLLVILILLFSGCGAGVADYSEELGNGYKFINYGSQTKYIRSPVLGQRDIYGTVVQNQYDNNFIIAVQHPDRKVYRIKLGYNIRVKDRLKYSENSESDIIKSERVADSLILNDTYYQAIFAHKSNLWIISKRDNCIYGPLTMEEYYRKRKELKVPDDLKFENENM